MSNELAFEFLKKEPAPSSAPSSVSEAAEQARQLLESIAQVFSHTGGNGLGNQSQQIISNFTQQYGKIRERLGREQLKIKDTDQGAFNQAENSLFQVYNMLRELAQISGIAWGGNTVSRGQPGNATASTKIDRLIEKYASVSEVAGLLSKYPSTSDFLKDLAKAQFELVGLDPNNIEHQQDEGYESSKKLHDLIMEFAAKFEPIEASYF
jgi:hypothetical protein